MPALRRRCELLSGKRRFLRCAVVLGLLWLVLLPATVSAQSVPSGRLAFMVSGRRSVGELADRAKYGVVHGAEAGYSPTDIERLFNIGAFWSMWWGRYIISDDTVSTDCYGLFEKCIDVLEMQAGFRLRLTLSEKHLNFATVLIGGSLHRTSLPVPPGNDRANWGGMTGIGYEHYVWGDWLLTGEMRYAVIGGAPRSVALIFGIAIGN